MQIRRDLKAEGGVAVGPRENLTPVNVAAGIHVDAFKPEKEARGLQRIRALVKVHAEVLPIAANAVAVEVLRVTDQPVVRQVDRRKILRAMLIRACEKLLLRGIERVQPEGPVVVEKSVHGKSFRRNGYFTQYSVEERTFQAENPRGKLCEPTRPQEDKILDDCSALRYNEYVVAESVRIFRKK